MFTNFVNQESWKYKLSFQTFARKTYPWTSINWFRNLKLILNIVLCFRGKNLLHNHHVAIFYLQYIHKHVKTRFLIGCIHSGWKYKGRLRSHKLVNPSCIFVAVNFTELVHHFIYWSFEDHLWMRDFLICGLRPLSDFGQFVVSLTYASFLFSIVLTSATNVNYFFVNTTKNFDPRVVD